MEGTKSLLSLQSSMKAYDMLGVRNSTFWQPYFAFKSFQRGVPGTKWTLPYALIYSSKYAGAHYYHIETRKRMLDTMEEELREGVYTKEFFDGIKKTFSDALAEVRKYADKNFSHASPEEIIAAYDAFIEMPQVTLFPMVVAHYFSDLLPLVEDELKKVLHEDEKDPQHLVELTAALLYPPTLTFVQQEDQALFDLHAYYRTSFSGVAGYDTDEGVFEKLCGEKDIADRLQKVAADYGWFHMEYMNEPRTAEEYQGSLWERVSGVPEDEPSPRDRLDAAMQKQYAFYAEHPDAIFLGDLAWVLQEQAIILDYSKASLIEGLYRVRPMIDEMARRWELPYWYLVLNLTEKETCGALKRGHLTDDEKALIAGRAERFAVFLENNTLSVHDGPAADDLKERLVEKETVEIALEVKGLIAMTGVARGIVKKVRSQEDIADFEEGNILVTHDATTEMTPTLRKAAAIVADHGGIISHAAIVAREYKIPCIVGAKNALTFFSDGDRIEVDGDKGVARKITEK